MTTVLRQLDHCVFCGGSEMTEEHLIADWVHRAFSKKRKPDGQFRATVVGSGLRFDGGDPVITAKVICRRCNNNWLSEIDNDAARVLRPLIRGEREVELDRAGQTAVAAWVYKTALIFDAAAHGMNGPLGSLRTGFLAARVAGPGCIMYVGPASAPPSVSVGDPPTEVNLWMLGVLPTKRKMLLTVTASSPDRATSMTRPAKELPIPGYRIMVGALWAYLGGKVCPVDAEALDGFSPIWPATDDIVTVRATSLITRQAA